MGAEMQSALLLKRTLRNYKQGSPCCHFFGPIPAGSATHFAGGT
jgi:hypothetical protein